jgi:hypothetical protein
LAELWSRGARYLSDETLETTDNKKPGRNFFQKDFILCDVVFLFVAIYENVCSQGSQIPESQSSFKGSGD